MKISAVVLTKNEELNIADCLDSLSFCDEIIVVDDNSEDRTVEIAQSLGEKVFNHTLDNNFSAQRNFAIEKASGEWVLFVDADERVSRLLKREIEKVVSDVSSKYSGFFIKRVDFLFGKQLKYGETGNIKFLRLGKKDRGGWEGEVHEEWEVKGEIGILENPLIHYPHQTISEFLRDINFYTDIRSMQLYKKGVKVNFLSIILYPKVKFLLNFFLKRGFLDGLPGFVFALMMSFHSFLVRAKLWMLWQKK